MIPFGELPDPVNAPSHAPCHHPIPPTFFFQVRAMMTTEPIPNQDPTQDNFFMRLRTKNQDVVSHKKTVDHYDQFFQDRTNLLDNEKHVEKRREGSDVLTNHFYNLVTDFYEYGMYKCLIWPRSCRSCQILPSLMMIN